MIKVSYCVAYDWQMLRTSVPLIYEQADIICVSVDKNRQSWVGTSFSWDEEGFRQMILEIDPKSKIVVYEDVFYNPSLLPMQNEVAQRNKIAEYLGKDGWHIQLDTDEYFVDFKSFIDFLTSFKSSRKVNICCPMINLYKQLPEGILWIKPSNFEEVEYFPIATQYPYYEYGRRNGYFNVVTDYSILHQSWARSEQEIWEKLNNWGHAKDFDVNKFFLLWKNVNDKNYTEYKNFHHLHPATWPALDLQCQIKDISTVSHLESSYFPLPIQKQDLAKANSIWLSRAKAVVSKIMKR